MSKISALVLLTTNKQVVIQLGSTLMTAHNDWELEGDWRFLVYNQNTYGLGTGTPPVTNGFTIGGWGETAAIPGAQPMKFNLIRIHETVFRKVQGYFYLGAGYRLTRYYAVVDESLNLSANPPVVTSSYAYNTLYGFNNSEYTVSGVTANFLYDSRDSTINAYRGRYLQAGIGGSPPGSVAVKRVPGWAPMSGPSLGSPTRFPATWSPFGSLRLAPSVGRSHTSPSRLQAGTQQAHLDGATFRADSAARPSSTQKSSGVFE
jgi:hypothetical protein